MRVGFLGLEVIGVPMALNLSRIFRLTVWNHSPGKYPLLTQAGANIGKTPAKVVEQSDIIFTMLFDGPTIQSILDNDFERAIRGKILVNSSSMSVEFSQFLAKQISQAGGDFIKMPVSGSKVPAEQVQLVGMMAGDATVAERVKPFVEPMTSAAIYCGPIGFGLKTNHEARSGAGLDVGASGQVLDADPMSSAYSRIKITTFEISAPGLIEAVLATVKEYLKDTKPAWTGIGVASLLHPALHIEVTVEAYLPESVVTA